MNKQSVVLLANKSYKINQKLFGILRLRMEHKFDFHKSKFRLLYKSGIALMFSKQNYLCDFSKTVIFQNRNSLIPNQRTKRNK